MDEWKGIIFVPRTNFVRVMDKLISRTGYFGQVIIWYDMQEESKIKY